MKILLDTNFILYCAKYKILSKLEETYPKIKFAILKDSIFELEKIRDKKLKTKKEDSISADIALQYLEIQNKKGNLEKIEIKKEKFKDVDTEIVEFLRERGLKESLMIGTHDKELSRKIDRINQRKRIVKIIRIRQKKYFIEL